MAIIHCVYETHDVILSHSSNTESINTFTHQSQQNEFIPLIIRSRRALLHAYTFITRVAEDNLRLNLSDVFHNFGIFYVYGID